MNAHLDVRNVIVLYNILESKDEYHFNLLKSLFEILTGLSNKASAVNKKNLEYLFLLNSKPAPPKK